MREGTQEALFLCGACGYEEWVTFVGERSKPPAAKKLSANPPVIAEECCPSCGAAVEFRFDQLQQYKWEENE